MSELKKKIDRETKERRRKMHNQTVAKCECGRQVWKQGELCFRCKRLHREIELGNQKTLEGY